MPKISAGLLMYRVHDGGAPEILLAHLGGPFYAKKDDGSWSIPRGEVSDGEELFAAAVREFTEETGLTPDLSLKFEPLGESLPYSSAKIVHAWAFEGDCDLATLASNTFTIEWPPHSGKMQEFPECDRFEFFSPDEARKKINSQLIPLLDRLDLLIKKS